jgi:hypothetical protein
MSLFANAVQTLVAAEQYLFTADGRGGVEDARVRGNGVVGPFNFPLSI